MSGIALHSRRFLRDISRAFALRLLCTSFGEWIVKFSFSHEYAIHLRLSPTISVLFFNFFFVCGNRNKFNPLWNYLLIAGCKKDGTAFLGSVDHIG